VVAWGWKSVELEAEIRPFLLSLKFSPRAVWAHRSISAIGAISMV
jgi:hypothetical protein